MDKMYIATFGEYYDSGFDSHYKTKAGARKGLAKILKDKKKEFLGWAEYENNMEVFFDIYFWYVSKMELKD